MDGHSFQHQQEDQTFYNEQNQGQLKSDNNTSIMSSASSSSSCSSSSFYTSDSENDYRIDDRDRQQQPDRRPRPATFVVFDNKLLFPEIIVLGGNYGISLEDINQFFEFLLLSRFVSQYQCDEACKIIMTPSHESILQCINTKYYLNPDILRTISSVQYQNFIDSPLWWNDVYKNKYPKNLYECLVIHTELINSVLMQNRRGKNSLKIWLTSSSCSSYRSNKNRFIRNAMQWIHNMEKTAHHQLMIVKSPKPCSATTISTSSKNQLISSPSSSNNVVDSCCWVNDDTKEGEIQSANTKKQSSSSQFIHKRRRVLRKKSLRKR